MSYVVRCPDSHLTRVTNVSHPPTQISRIPNTNTYGCKTPLSNVKTHVVVEQLVAVCCREFQFWIMYCACVCVFSLTPVSPALAMLIMDEPFSRLIHSVYVCVHSNLHV